MSQTTPPLLPLMQQLHATMGCPTGTQQEEEGSPCPYCNTGQCSGLCHSSHLSPNAQSGTFSTSQNFSMSSFLESLPIGENGSGLSSFDHDTLERYLTPVMEALKAMDAETVLDLERTTDQKKGARLRNGVYVKPIHAEINPPKQQADGASCVRYLHLSEVENKYSIGIFVFAPYATIPLHDHPGMCVLSRVLYGDLHRLSLDLLPTTRSKWFCPKNKKRALKNGVDYLQAPDTTALYPHEGNLHEFCAGPNGAAVLDVLLPPYNDGRDCTFYKIQGQERECWIVPTKQPEDFYCLPGSFGNVGEKQDDDESDSDATM